MLTTIILGIVGWLFVGFLTTAFWLWFNNDCEKDVDLHDIFESWRTILMGPISTILSLAYFFLIKGNFLKWYEDITKGHDFAHFVILRGKKKDERRS